VLYQRLVDRKNDPSIENWILEIVTRTIYLDRRYSLVKSNIGGSHKLLHEGLQHSQTERAAVITVAMLEFKQKFESGQMEPAYLNEVPLCMRGHDWFFNSCREPRQDVDTTNKFPSNNELVVMYRGHLFKLQLSQNGKNVAYSQLQATFQAILDSVKDDSWLSILTTQERNTWAEVSRSYACKKHG